MIDSSTGIQSRAVPTQSNTVSFLPLFSVIISFSRVELLPYARSQWTVEGSGICLQLPSSRIVLFAKLNPYGREKGRIVPILF